MYRRRLMMQTSKPYIELEYIESTGTQYIDTGYLMQKGDYVRFKATDVTNEIRRAIYGTVSTSTNRYYFARTTNASWLFYYSSKAANIPYNTELFADFDASKYGKNGIAALYTLTIFARNNVGVVDDINIMKLHSFQILDEGGYIIMDFIPVMRKSDGEICLYDKVTNQFFTNQGTGKFIGGPYVS